MEAYWSDCHSTVRGDAPHCPTSTSVASDPGLPEFRAPDPAVSKPEFLLFLQLLLDACLEGKQRGELKKNVPFEHHHQNQPAATHRLFIAGIQQSLLTVPTSPLGNLAQHAAEPGPFALEKVVLLRLRERLFALAALRFRDGLRTRSVGQQQVTAAREFRLDAPPCRVYDP